MKNYREELNRFRQTNFELLDLEISNELDYCLENAEENARLKPNDIDSFGSAICWCQVEDIVNIVVFIDTSAFVFAK